MGFICIFRNIALKVYNCVPMLTAVLFIYLFAGERRAVIKFLTRTHMAIPPPKLFFVAPLPLLDSTC